MCPLSTTKQCCAICTELEFSIYIPWKLTRSHGWLLKRMVGKKQYLTEKRNRYFQSDRLQEAVA